MLEEPKSVALWASSSCPTKAFGQGGELGGRVGPELPSRLCSLPPTLKTCTRMTRMTWSWIPTWASTCPTWY